MSGSHIPSHAERVFSGVIFEVFQWDQPMFDGSIARFEYARRPAGCNIIAVSGETIFIARQEQPRKGVYYSFFGGGMEEGETPLEAAQRELQEEAALKSDTWEEWAIYNESPKVDYPDYVYIARDCQPNGTQNLDAGERIEVIESSWEELVALIRAGDFRCPQAFARRVLNAIIDGQEEALKREILFGEKLS